ncbi:MAG: methyl-accepting chemotaxis protein, partial [Burkholderiaceae bacterium]|nr:methyl-accepting chemotaxis protein [Burkholderiaceae bacterium]
MKLPAFLQPRTNRYDDLSPDTAILDELLPDETPDAPPTPVSPPGVRSERPPQRSEARLDAAGRPAAAGLAGGTTSSPSPMIRGTTSRERFRVPVIGAMPVHKQLQVWLPTLLVSLLIAFSLLWFDSRQTNDASLWYQQIGDALTQSQRVAKAASQSIAGDPTAFDPMIDARNTMDRALARLADGSAEARAVPADLAPDMRTLRLIWTQSSDAVQSIANQSVLLQSLGGTRAEVMRANPKMLEAAQTVAANKLRDGAAPREVAAAAELVVLTQRIAKDLNELILSGMSSKAAEASLRQSMAGLQESTDNLLTGNDRLRLSATSEPEARRALTALKQMTAEVGQSLAEMLAAVPALQQAKRAEQHIVGDSEVMRALLEAIRTKLRSGEAIFAWVLGIAATFGVIALLAVYGLFRAFLSDSEHRTADAVRQKAVAEDQEQDAKRTNDQNQAAILRLMNELQEVADGDLTVQATVSEDITGAIADSVNYTVEELRNLVARINTTAALVNEASSKAQMTASSLQAASEQQSREIRDTGEAVLRMATQIEDVSARASQSVQVARQSLGASEEGSRAVNNAISGMNGIRDQIQETAKRIKRLGESSQEIGEIV